MTPASTGRNEGNCDERRAKDHGGDQADRDCLALELHFHVGVFSAVSLSGTGLLLAVLFSMFCVTLDVERIGAAFLKGEDSPNQF
jgi:hypothetical protein